MKHLGLAAPEQHQHLHHHVHFTPERPEIYEKFLVNEERLQRSFALAAKARSALKLEPELCDRRESFRAQGGNDLQVCDKPVAERTKHLARLHGQYLEVLGELRRFHRKRPNRGPYEGSMWHSPGNRRCVCLVAVPRDASETGPQSVGQGSPVAISAIFSSFNACGHTGQRKAHATLSDCLAH